MKPRRQSGIIMLVALVEIALVAAIVLAFVESSWTEQVPGGRLVVVAAAAGLLLVSALGMTVLVSD